MFLPDILSRSCNALTNHQYNINWKEEQIKDPNIKIIIDKLQSKANIDNKYENYILRDGILYKEIYDNNYSKNFGNPLKVIVVPTKLTRNLISIAHNEMPYGHLGVAATCWMLKRNFYWKNIINDVKGYIQQCAECQYTKNLKIKPGLMLPVQQKIMRPFQLIGVDIAGPLPITKNQNRFFLVMIDYFTGWVECYALQNIDTQTILKKFKKWISRFGIPEGIISDNGSQFMSNMAKTFYEKFNIRKKTTSSYHPQTDGKAERTIGVIKNIIKRNIINHKEEWDELLDLACFAIRSCAKTSSGKPSPSEALYGFKIRTPIDLLNDNQIDSSNDIQENRKIIWLNILKQSEQYINHYESYVNKKRTKVEYSTGQLVLVKKINPKALQPKYEGPFRIRKIIGPNTVTLEKINGDSLRFKGTINVDRIKPFHSQPEVKHDDDELFILHEDKVEPISLNDQTEIDLIASETINEIVLNQDHDQNNIYDQETSSEEDNDYDNDHNNDDDNDNSNQDNIIINANIIDDNIAQPVEEITTEEKVIEWINPRLIKRNNIDTEMLAHNLQVSKKAPFYDKLREYENAYKSRND